MEETKGSTDDRTVEMRIPPGGLPPIPPKTGTATAPPAARADATPPRNDATLSLRPDPKFPESNTLASRLPEGISGQRPSPALDPIARGNVSRLAKWGLLVCALLGFLWLPTSLFSYQDAAAGKSGFSQTYYLAVAVTATILAAVIATGLPRTLLPNVFGKWGDASEAFRDWLVVGVINGLLYGTIVFAIKFAKMNLPSEDFGDWLKYRLPLVAVSSLIAMFIGRFLALRQEGVVGGGVGAVWQTILQAVLTGLLVRPLELGIIAMTVAGKWVPLVLGAGAILFGAAALGIITWAASADAKLLSLRGRGKSGVNDGGPVDMTLTVIGGRESGKTVLLAAAFYEWTTQGLGNLRITPAEDSRGDGNAGIRSLELVARELYINQQFPVGTVSTQNLPFELWMDDDKVARFTFLDYPGGAIAGNVADKRYVEEFYERVQDTDGIILIADASYVRRGRKEQDWIDVRNAYREVMQRIIRRNGKNRVIPVALVMTKCDEYVDANTGHIDMGALQAGMEDFEYTSLEDEWRALCAKDGPGFAEFTTWVTSAISYSQPQLDRNGLPDYTKPFEIAPPPPPIKPTGCASPLLWMTSKVMRWNYTIYSDIRRFVMGSSPKVRNRVDAILEMEQVAEQRRGRA
jgi:GTPase SAR1 family protein